MFRYLTYKKQSKLVFTPFMNYYNKQIIFKQKKNRQFKIKIKNKRIKRRNDSFQIY